MVKLTNFNIEIRQLLTDVLENAKQYSIDVSKFEIDHVGFRASNNTEYESKKTEFEKVGILVKEIIVRNRPIAIFEFKRPIKVGEYSIKYFEVMSPALGDRVFKRKWEHVEFLVNEPLVEFKKKYPNVKFNTVNLNKEYNSELILNFPNNANAKFREKPVLED